MSKTTMQARSQIISGALPSSQTNTFRLEIEERLSCMARQLETAGESYSSACKQLVVVAGKLSCRDRATRMHVQNERLFQLAELFPAMFAMIMQLRKDTLASDQATTADALAPAHLLARVKTLDALLDAMLTLVMDELARAQQTLNAVLAA